MRVDIQLRREDVLTGEEEIIFEGPAILNHDRLVYFEERGGAKQTVTFEEGKIVLERVAEISSRTVLRTEGTGSSRVDSPYGIMSLDTVLRSFDKDEDRWMVEYQVLSGNEPVTDQRLIWKFFPSAK